MAGSRALNQLEERRLIRHSRRLNARDRALICAQYFLGFRISENLALTIQHVLHRGRIRALVALPPRCLKGGYGATRVVPVGPELHRALDGYVRARARRENLRPDAPLFLSRERGADGGPRALSRSTAERIIKRALLRVCTEPQGLSSHTLRKSWAVRLFEESGHDLLMVRDGLGHGSAMVTERYLPIRRAALHELIRKSDWTRRSTRPAQEPIPAALSDSGRSRVLRTKAKPEAKTPADVPAQFLPGREPFAA